MHQRNAYYMKNVSIIIDFIALEKKRTMMNYAGTREIHRSYKNEQNSTDLTKK